MAGNGSKKESPVSEGWPQLLAGGGLVLAVAAILIVAAVLETPESPARPAPPAREGVAEPAPPSSDTRWQPVAAPLAAVTLEPAPDTAVKVETNEPALDALSQRVLEDPARLRRTGAAFTAQLAFACRRDTVERILDRSNGASDLYVLPEARNGGDCFRVCWGTYASREEALQVNGLPGGLRDGLGKPDAKRIAELGL